MYKKKCYFNVDEFLGEKIHAFVAKLGNRCFCWFPGGGDSHMKQAGMLVRNFEFNP